MKNILPALLLSAVMSIHGCDAIAKGGFSSSAGSGSRGGYSSAPSRPSSAPSYSAPRATTTTTTTINRSYSSGNYNRSYRYGGGGGYYYHPMMMYPGMGMGYSYSNGLVEGLIIGNLMHPQGTTVYSGGGYGGSALLYPDGRVVDQNGYQVGNYANGQFAPVQNGPMVAQQAPANPQEQPVQTMPPAQPVIIEHRGPDVWKIIGWIVLGLFGFLFLVWLVRWIMSWSFWNDDEDYYSRSSVETTTTTTTTTEEAPQPTVAGELKRKRQGAQFYVIDPSDQSKNWLNDRDDMYEDAQGRVWRLV